MPGHKSLRRGKGKTEPRTHEFYTYDTEKQMKLSGLRRERGYDNENFETFLSQYDSANAFYHMGNAEEAERAYREHLDARPSDPEALTQWRGERTQLLAERQRLQGVVDREMRGADRLQSTMRRQEKQSYDDDYDALSEQIREVERTPISVQSVPVTETQGGRQRGDKKRKREASSLVKNYGKGYQEPAPGALGQWLSETDESGASQIELTPDQLAMQEAWRMAGDLSPISEGEYFAETNEQASKSRRGRR